MASGSPAVDDVFGKLDKAAASVKAREVAVPDASPGFKPVRVWNAGPGDVMTKFLIPGTTKKIGFSRHGYMILHNEVELETAKRGLGEHFWTDDVPADEPSLRCDGCGWTTRSMKAFVKHANNAHPKPQTL